MCTVFFLRYTICGHTAVSHRCARRRLSISASAPRTQPSSSNANHPRHTQDQNTTHTHTQTSSQPQQTNASQIDPSLTQPPQQQQQQLEPKSQTPLTTTTAITAFHNPTYACTNKTSIHWKMNEKCMDCRIESGLVPGLATRADEWGSVDGQGYVGLKKEYEIGEDRDGVEDE